jgi:hypothetical protein
MLVPALAGAGALYGGYKAKKVYDRMIGEGLKPTQEISTPKLDADWQRILAQSEANRIAKQADAQKKIADNLATQQTIDAVHQIDRKGVPETIQATLQPEPSVQTVKPNKIGQMMAGQEMRNPLGGLASAYTEPIRPPSLPKSEIPTIADLTNQVVGTAPVAPPETTKQIATEAVEGKKKGRPAGAKNLTEEQRLAAQASKGTNMYLNMFGFDKNDPTSPKSLAAVESTQRFINEAMGGVPPASRDPLLNPEGDIAPSGKKFYSGTPEGYRNAYIPWLQENLHTLPPETQSHVLHAMTKGQTGDIGKLVKGMGLVGILGASGAAFSAPVQNRARDVRNAIGEALLPLGVTPSELQPGTLGPEQIRAFQEAQKLGSPYRSVPPPR